MSNELISGDIIREIVKFMVTRNQVTGEKTMCGLDFGADRAEIVHVLHVQNVKSASAYYSHNPEIQAEIAAAAYFDEGWDERTRVVSPVQALKHWQYYTYNSDASGSKWVGSRAEAIMERFLHIAIEALEGYDAAEWGESGEW